MFQTYTPRLSFFLPPRNYLHVAYLLLYLDSYLHGCTCVVVLHAGVWSLPLYNSDDTFLIISETRIDFHSWFSSCEGISSVPCGVLSRSARLKLVLLLPCSEALDYVDNYAATQVRLPPIRSSATCGREKNPLSAQSNQHQPESQTALNCSRNAATCWCFYP